MVLRPSQSASFRSILRRYRGRGALVLEQQHVDGPLHGDAEKRGAGREVHWEVKRERGLAGTAVAVQHRVAAGGKHSVVVSVAEQGVRARFAFGGERLGGDDLDLVDRSGGRRDDQLEELVAAAGPVAPVAAVDGWR